MEGGKEQNYWPGFVDALSNVVLTLVFVLVVFVFALAMASNKIERKLLEIQPENLAKHNSLTEENAALKNQVHALTAELQQLKASYSNEQKKSLSRNPQDDSKVVSSISTQEAAGSEAASVKTDRTRITVYFSPMVSDLDEGSAKEIEIAAAKIVRAMPAYRVEIRSFIGNESYSIANRNAYYRAVNIRGALVERCQIPSASMDLKTVQVTHPGAPRVEVSFVAE